MILPYPEVHEMERAGNIFRCPYCDQVYVFKNGKLQHESGVRKLINRILVKLGLRKSLKFCNINASHFYYSNDVRIAVRVKELGDE